MSAKTAGFTFGAAMAAFAAANVTVAQMPDQHFENWTYSCAEGACQIFETLADNKTKVAKFSLSAVYDPATDRVSAFLRMPLAVALPPGVRVFAGKENYYDWPYQFCDAAGCQAIAVLDAAALEKFKDAEALQVQFFTYGKTTMDSFSFPMAGFENALAKLIAEAEKK